MNDKLQLIREKCIATNPEIMELKFGCLFKAAGELRMCLQECIGGIKALTIIEDEDDMVYGIAPVFFQREDMTIFGRPIRLADVLLAIKQNINRQWERYFQLINRWNLGADDLKQQSSLTIDFIANLLQ